MTIKSGIVITGKILHWDAVKKDSSLSIYEL